MSAPRIADIVRATADVYGISTNALKHAGRGRSVGRSSYGEARAVACYLSRRLTARSLRQIGDAVGDPPVNNVPARIKSITRRLGDDERLREIVARVTARVCVTLINRPLPPAALELHS